MLPLTCGVADLARGRIDRRDGAVVQLTSTERALLVYLAGRPGRDVPRTELLSQVWGYAPGASTRTLDTAVKVLRRKIEVDPARPDHVLTVWGVGYRFEPLQAPTEDGDFVGRAAELAEVREALRGGARVLSLWGPGGVGKTRLARQAVAELDRAVFVSLVGVTAEDVEEPVVLALPDPSGRPLEQRLALAPWVVVLDNADHLGDALREVVPRWLRVAPALQLVFTTRTSLGLPDEQQIEVHPLSAPAGAALFRRRLSQARRSDAAEPDVLVQQLVAELDGLPLALELAASQGAVLGLDDILRRGPAGLNRGGALANLVRSSVDLLAPATTEALVACAVFRGSFGGADVEAALPDHPDPIGALQALVDASLVQRQDDDSLHVMPVIREALPSLVGPAAPALRRRVAAIVIEQAERSLSLAGKWVRDLRAAFDADDLPPGLVARAGMRFVDVVGRQSAVDRTDTLRRIRAHAEASGDAALLAEAQVLVCAGALRNGPRRIEPFDEALALARATGDRARVGWALSHLGTFHRLEGHNALAVSVLLEAEAEVVAAGTALHRVAYILAERALARRAAGDLLGAVADLERALPFALRAEDDLRLEQVTRLRLGTTLAALGRYDAAESHLALALELAERAGIEVARFEIRATLSTLASWRGDLDTAAAELAWCLSQPHLGTAFHFGLLHAESALIAILRDERTVAADHVARAVAALADRPGALVAAGVHVADGVWRLVTADPGARAALTRAVEVDPEGMFGVFARGFLALLPDAAPQERARAAQAALASQRPDVVAFGRALTESGVPPSAGLHARLVQRILQRRPMRREP